jgi:hypothetical protein
MQVVGPFIAGIHSTTAWARNKLWSTITSSILFPKVIMDLLCSVYTLLPYGKYTIMFRVIRYVSTSDRHEISTVPCPHASSPGYAERYSSNGMIPQSPSSEECYTFIAFVHGSSNKQNCQDSKSQAGHFYHCCIKQIMVVISSVQPEQYMSCNWRNLYLVLNMQPVLDAGMAWKAILKASDRRWGSIRYGYIPALALWWFQAANGSSKTWKKVLSSKVRNT